MQRFWMETLRESEGTDVPQGFINGLSTFNRFMMFDEYVGNISIKFNVPLNGTFYSLIDKEFSGLFIFMLLLFSLSNSLSFFFTTTGRSAECNCPLTLRVYSLIKNVARLDT